MPTLPSMIIPPPENETEFERIALSCLRIKWGSSDLVLNGRRGQFQGGVDIYGSDDSGRFVGIQCKKRKGKIRPSDIKDWIAQAEDQQPPIAAFYIATSASSDARILQQVRLTSQNRIRQKKFPVGIFFWEDLIQELIRDRDAMKIHYPDLRLEPHETIERSQRIPKFTEDPVECPHCERQSIMRIPGDGEYIVPPAWSSDRQIPDDFGKKWQWYILMCPYCYETTVIQEITDYNVYEWNGTSYDSDGYPDEQPITYTKRLYPNQP